MNWVACGDTGIGISVLAQADQQMNKKACGDTEIGSLCSPWGRSVTELGGLWCIEIATSVLALTS